MKLRDFSYWSRWHLTRNGLDDFDVFLFWPPTPLGFYQPRARSIAISLPHVLLDSWRRVIDKTFLHEVAHAKSDREAEKHGELWAREARINGSWYREPGDISDAFHAYTDRYLASHWARIMTIEEAAIAETMLKETQQRGRATYKGRLRFDFILDR